MVNGDKGLIFLQLTVSAQQLSGPASLLCNFKFYSIMKGSIVCMHLHILSFHLKGLLLILVIEFIGTDLFCVFKLFPSSW